jgi:hypothetical protein
MRTHYSSTKINYSISQTSFVTLKLYDILGREIATLVNEEKQPEDIKLNLMEVTYQVESISTSSKQGIIPPLRK